MTAVDMSIHRILILLHTGSNTGYAIAPLERVFYRMAAELVHDPANIHFGYRNLQRGRPETLPEGFPNIAALDPRSDSPEALATLSDYVSRHAIDTVFAFDAPVSLPGYAPMRRAGVRRIVSYQGAPMSSIYHGPRLLLKRAEVRLRPYRPEHYIFESEAMRATAVNGRGIARAATSVVYLGADGNRYRPRGAGYAHQTFGIPEHRNVVVFSGHMERRKGVHVLVRTFVELASRGRDDIHLVVMGNKGGEAGTFLPLYEGTPAERLITFGGYRDDVPEVFGSADIGAIASTGWDSFTMSSVEMALSGLPLLVSDLQGLSETVEHGVTGYTFPPGDAGRLADLVEQLVDNESQRRRMGEAGRKRALGLHSEERQVQDLARVVRAVASARKKFGLGTAA